MYKKKLITPMLILSLLLLTACEPNFFPNSADPPPGELMKVEIHFTDNEILVGYIKNLEIEEEGRIYIGGSSVNYLYDREGKIIGSYNYLRVLYILIIEEVEEEQAQKDAALTE